MRPDSALAHPSTHAATTNIYTPSLHDALPISYIHAEAYAAGELKHGPLALVDADMPVITVAPNNDLLEKLKSNLRSEEHTSELQSQSNLVCRLLLEKKKSSTPADEQRRTVRSR